ncbi:hypothetical protein E2C01_077945 [Portunus trituberculatus]|uniref:Uncharacterized protein n=1 Tax=Portunus trituberculatus TaxID=210409 RepID=A0A5B7ICP3_PORTR|nr:hypothetical protein [Portunus trituberculatus]
MECCRVGGREGRGVECGGDAGEEGSRLRVAITMKAPIQLIKRRTIAAHYERFKTIQGGEQRV